MSKPTAEEYVLGGVAIMLVAAILFIIYGLIMMATMLAFVTLVKIALGTAFFVWLVYVAGHAIHKHL